MKRRQFIYNGGVLATGLGVSGTAFAQNFDCYVQRLPGVQLYTLREALAADPEAALQALAVAGIREVELYGLTSADSVFGMPLLSFRTLLDRYNLSMTCTHVFAENIEVAAVSRSARILGIDTVILTIAPGFIQNSPEGMRVQGPQSIEEMDNIAELLNSLGRQFRTEGMLFGYHNHHVEFLPVAGEIPYNHILWNTDPQFVRCELDIGWMALAGVDYLDVLDRFGHRTLSCHMKDFNGNTPTDMGDFLGAAAHLVPPGSGVVNFAAVLERMDYYNIRHGFVEIDSSENPLGDIASGADHLQLIRQCN
jgi:sugar phosphate isomerase/epimerase